MSGAPRRSIPPATDAQWAREVERRLAGLETPESLRAGPWVIAPQPQTGNLIASHSEGGARLLGQVPPPDASGEPDIVYDDTDGAEPAPEPEPPPPLDDTCSVTRNASQLVSNATVTTATLNVTDWDISSSGSAMANGTGITIRRDGIYAVDAWVAWQSNETAGRRFMSVLAGGTVLVADNRPADTPGGSMYTKVNTQATLTAGTQLIVSVFHDRGFSINMDNTRFGGRTFPRLSVSMVHPLDL